MPYGNLFHKNGNKSTVKDESNKKLMKNFKFDKNRCIFIEVVQNIFLTRYCSFMDQTI